MKRESEWRFVGQDELRRDDAAQKVWEEKTGSIDRKPRKCKYCDQTNLTWVIDCSKWKLATEDGTIHVCVKIDRRTERAKEVRQAWVATQ